MMKHVADCFPLITLQNFEHQPLPTESTLEIRVSASGSFKLYIFTVSCINRSNSIKRMCSCSSNLVYSFVYDLL